MPFISTSIGIVMRRSTSSAAWPGHCETTWTCGGDRSGYASIGRCWKATTPQPPRQIMPTTTMNRCDRANETMRSIMGSSGAGAPSAVHALRKLQEQGALGDDVVAGIEAVGDFHLVALLAAGLDEPLRELAGADLQIDERKVLFV